MIDLKARMIKLWTSDDPDTAHREADAILCEALERAGETDLVEAWRAVRRWYS